MNGINSKVVTLAKIDLNLFRVFAAIYREKNLTRAGEQLFLSQSTMSHALGRLREHFGDPLFIRDGHGVAATPLAKRLWPDINQALQLLHGTLERLYSFDAKRDLKQITIAMNDEIEPVLLPPIAKWFDEHIPDIQINSIRVDRKNLRQDLMSGRIDFAIDIVHLTEVGVAHQVLIEDNFVVMLNPENPLARSNLSKEEYILAEHIVVSARPTGRTVEDVLLTRQNIKRKVRIRCQQYEAASRIAANSHLLLTIPQSLASYLQSHFQIKTSPLPIELENISLHLYWDDTKSMEQQTLWCKEQFSSIFQKLETINKKI